MATSRTTDATGAVSEALHAALSGGAVTGLSGEPVPYYEHVRKKATAPYVRLGPTRMVEGAAAPGGSYGGAQLVRAQVDTFSAYRGRREIDHLQDQVYALVMAGITLPAGYLLTRTTAEQGRIIEEEGGVRHGVYDFLFRIQIL